MPTVFISHASPDAPLAERLVTLLTKGCSLRANEIFCTSVEGSNNTTGELFAPEVRAKLADSEIVVLLVTPMWWDKAFCIAEAGAAWALGKKVFPLIVDGSREMGAHMLGTQTRALDHAGLSDLKDAIAGANPAANAGSPKWVNELTLFMEDLPALRAALPRPDKVTRRELDDADAGRAAALDEVRAARAEIARLGEQIAALRAAKDADEVRAIDREFTEADAQFTALVDAAQEALSGLSSAERRALLATFAGHPWRPSQEMWRFERGEMEAMKANGRVHDSGGGYVVDLEDPVMEAAHEAVCAVGEFLGDHEEIAADVRANFRVKPTITAKPFWEEVLRASFIE